MNFLRDMPVLVLGLGDSGLAMARWCARCGANVTVWDSRETPPGADKLRAEWPAVQLISGALGIDRLAGMQLVLKSPGLAPHDARIAPLLNEARSIGIAVLGELDLFARALLDLKTPAVVEAPVEAPVEDESEAGIEVELETDEPAIQAEAEPGSEPEVESAAAEAEKPEVAEELRPLPIALPPVVVIDPNVYAPQVLAITGTNGKTTTTAMAAMLVARTGKRVAMAGNIGPTLLDTLSAALELPMEERPEVWVLELSSFQLDGGGIGVRGFEPSAAVVLNITQDHLDWHGNMAAYSAAKARVYGDKSGDKSGDKAGDKASGKAVMVINRDDPLVEAMVPQPLPVKGKAKPKPIDRTILRFGLNAPTLPGDFGLVTESGMAWLVRALPVDDTFKLKKGEEVEIHLQRLMPADALRVRGRHNAANALAALSLATAIGCPLAPMLHGLREYTGEPHRVQPVGVLGGVEAYDDSKGTNVGATVAALNGLGEDKTPGKLVVILGGDGKGQDFTPLTQPLAQHARAVATIGRDAAAIEAVIEGVPLQRHETLEAAVTWCFEQARSGDAVLLSPACASLDMFRNYAHRAEVFVQAVQQLAADRGEVV